MTKAQQVLQGMLDKQGFIVISSGYTVPIGTVFRMRSIFDENEIVTLVIVGVSNKQEWDSQDYAETPEWMRLYNGPYYYRATAE